MRDDINSLELYLNYPAGEVVEVNKLIDVGGSIYPSYYYSTGESLRVSTSVTELIADLGDIEWNDDFEAPNYLGRSGKGTVAEQILSVLPKSVESMVPQEVAHLLRMTPFFPITHSTDGQELIDNRINRLDPLSQATIDGEERNFSPTYSLTDKDEFVKKSSEYIQKFVNEVERRFPRHEHIILMGGKDSQIISLVPKVLDSWHVFSAYPNYPLVENFLKKNKIDVKNLFTHDNVNDESMMDLRKKVICSDLRGDPRHIRWRPKLAEIVDQLDGNCIFWAGTAADAIYAYHPSFHGLNAQRFFKKQFSGIANWQGTTHQTTKNYTGAPMISPYHSEMIWENVYQHYDPSMIKKGMDLRDSLGKELAGRQIHWMSKNPNPDPYDYPSSYDLQSMYTEYAESYVNGTETSVIRD